MQLSKKVLDALNKQMNEELFNSMTYFAMSTHANYLGFFGAEKWLKNQADQEREHMQKFAAYICDANYVFTISDMRAPLGNFDSLMDIFKAALAREIVTTKNCNELRALAIGEKDQNTEVFMNWFVNEQTEELAWANEMIARLKVAGDNGAALLQIDQYLGS
jgi:ferritin